MDPARLDLSHGAAHILIRLWSEAPKRRPQRDACDDDRAEPPDGEKDMQPLKNE
jgi:hypothetical protein